MLLLLLLMPMLMLIPMLPPLLMMPLTPMLHALLLLLLHASLQSSTMAQPPWPPLLTSSFTNA